jgi:hypothetical protein
VYEVEKVDVTLFMTQPHSSVSQSISVSVSQSISVSVSQSVSEAESQNESCHS